MAKDNEISKAQVKRIESLLFKYKKIPLMIKKLELEIEITKHTYEGIRGKSDNEIMASSRTNANSSSVENEVLNKERRIEQIKAEIVNLKFDKDMIEIALESLTEVERGIVADRYFDKMSYYKLGEKHYFSKDWAYYTCQRIVNKMMEYFIVDDCNTNTK